MVSHHLAKFVGYRRYFTGDVIRFHMLSLKSTIPVYLCVKGMVPKHTAYHVIKSDIGHTSVFSRNSKKYIYKQLLSVCPKTSRTREYNEKNIKILGIANLSSPNFAFVICRI